MMTRKKDDTTVQILDGDRKPLTPPLPLSEFKRRAGAVVDTAAAKHGAKVDRDASITFPDGSTVAHSNAQTAQEQLRALVDRIENLEAEKAATAEDIKEVYAEAQGDGFDVRVLRLVVRRRRRRRQEVQEEDETVRLYEDQLENMA